MKVDLTNPATVTYSRLLEDARDRSLLAKKFIFGGWTKEQRCVLVLREIFEKFKAIDLTNNIGQADNARKALTKVLLNDVLPKVGPVAASLVVGRKDEMKVFFELLTKSHNLEKVEPSLGVKSPVGIDVNGQPIQAGAQPQQGYANIYQMNNEQIKACRASLAKFADRLDAITEETCLLLGYNKDDLYGDLGIAKAQLDGREAWLKNIASLLPGELRRFARQAKQRHGWTLGGPTEGDLQTSANTLKTKLNLVGSLYKGKTDENLVKLSSQIDDFIELGYVSRRKGAEDDDFRQPILRISDLVWSGACAFVGPALIELVSKEESEIGKMVKKVFPSSGWSALASGVVGLLASSYLNGGFVASLFV